MSRRARGRAGARQAAPAPARTVATPARSAGLTLGTATLVALACAAALRLAATWNDLWLDEVWTLTLIDQLHSPLGILTEIRHDNNHVLNTFALYLLRPLGSDWAYRLPAWAAGVATLVVATRLAALPTGAEPSGDAPPGARALVAAVVLGASHPLVHWGSEARGYAFAIAFGLAAILVAVRDGVAPRSRSAPVAWACLALAILGHALALHVLVALVAWGTVRAVRRDGFPRGLAAAAWWFAVPCAFFVFFYLAFLRGITVGGGNREGIVPPLLGAVSMTTGLPFDAPGELRLAVAAVLVAVGIAWLVARRSDEWILYFVGIVGSPLLLAVLQPTNLYAERYFLVSATLLLVLVARVAAAAIAKGGAARLVVVAVLALYLGVNLARIGRLLTDGRGGYRRAIAYAVRQSGGAEVTIASDHDFRNRLLVEYHGPRVAAGRPVRYLRANDQSGVVAEWYIAHRTGGDAPPLATLDRRGVRYELRERYPTAPLSGLTWFLYQRGR